MGFELGIDQATRFSAAVLLQDANPVPLAEAAFDYGPQKDPVAHIAEAQKTLGTFIYQCLQQIDGRGRLNVTMEDAIVQRVGDPKPSLRLSGWLISFLLERGITPKLVLPGQWQKAMGLKANGKRIGTDERKAWAEAQAGSFGYDPFPNAKGPMRKKRSDLCDAYLIAKYGLQNR